MQSLQDWDQDSKSLITRPSLGSLTGEGPGVWCSDGLTNISQGFPVFGPYMHPETGIAAGLVATQLTEHLHPAVLRLLMSLERRLIASHMITLVT